MSHLTTTKPYWCISDIPGPIGFSYWCDDVGTELSCNPHYELHNFDTEDELATFVDGIKGIPGWYYECENRIPYPPNLVEWDYETCVENRLVPPED